ncbi:GDSL esterase/lipase CPRD49 isoform X1 [Ricinus communis]|uniref:Isoamyl acetate-hydrolyzing esterase, putative n=1 Tax=Ricinus communis TaxID=3988 RepID=B9SQ29_RICCO|nr:GDSL esterase/lipase CPRD49 isoform X1 [Ricinus communis]EEF34277.1 Isoamyl acetate-hydrolyzing esterase, putative [Ricinus communis]|eukprot:XP_002528098.1 GDSL esterase/lipase CPRD49 isoform X1 [Ricinus communis]
MVGPVRPQFVLFGSSIVQLSYSNGGWGAILANLYARKADILLRGYGGWNSRNALHILDQVFPENAPVQPALAIVYFGGNDSVQPLSTGFSPHVPLPEYIENMKKIVQHLKSLSEKTRLIFLSAPPVNEEMIRQYFGGNIGRTNETCRIYSEACLKLCREIGVTAIDLWTAMQQRDDWLTACFTDGIHLSEEGSKIVVNEIMKVLRNADWEPNLHWTALPSEFVGVTPKDPEGKEAYIFKKLQWELDLENVKVTALYQ